MQSQRYPRLWHSVDDDVVRIDDEGPLKDGPRDISYVSSSGTTAAFIRARMMPSTSLVNVDVRKPAYRSLGEIANNSVVVGQELALTCLFLTRHRAITPNHEGDLEENLEGSGTGSRIFVAAVAVIVILILYYGESTRSSLSPCQRRDRLFFRATDAVLLAAILRFLSSVLRTLTASFSSDTVNALAIFGMAVHVLACDYAYALGHQSQRQGVDAAEEGRPTGRPNFLGGTVSLNAALFSTTLLASRLDSDVSSYAFISSAVVLFAFYPAARHAIARKRLSTSAKWQFISPCKIITTIAIVTTVPLLANALELFFFFSTMLFVCVVSPTSLWVLQRHKGVVVGPWDIAHIVVDD